MAALYRAATTAGSEAGPLERGSVLDRGSPPPLFPRVRSFLPFRPGPPPRPHGGGDFATGSAGASFRSRTMISPRSKISCVLLHSADGAS